MEEAPGVPEARKVKAERKALKWPSFLDLKGALERPGASGMGNGATSSSRNSFLKALPPTLPQRPLPEVSPAASHPAFPWRSRTASAYGG